MKDDAATGGYTLIEVLIALGVLTAIGLISAQIYKTVIRDSQQQQLAATRDQVVLWVRQSAGNPQNLRNSLKQPENVQFYNCVCGQGAGCASAQTYEFTLYDLPTASPVPVPRYYNASGLPCEKTVKNCLIEVTIHFMAQCLPDLPDADPTPPASCSGKPVEFVGIFFKVQQNPSTIDQGNLFRSVSGTAFTQVTNINPGSGVCP